MNPYDNTAPLFALLGQALFWGLLLFLLACPICSAIVATSKGRDSVLWFVLGLIFGPFGLLAAIGVTAIDKEVERAYAGRPSLKKICPACQEPMWNTANVCPHCRTLIDGDGILDEGADD